MSPRRTEFCHQAGDSGHLGPVRFVSLQCSGLGGEGFTVSKTFDFVPFAHRGSAHCFGLCQLLGLDPVKGVVHR